MNPMSDVTRFFHPVLAASKLKRAPVRVELAGNAYVLFRDASGRAAALADTCAHRRAPLSAGRVRPDGRLACPYHGWHYDAEGKGRSPSQPSLTKCDVPAFQLVERYDYLWLASRDAPASAFPEMEAPGFEYVGGFGMRFDAPLHVAFDNFSEDEHTPWVHHRLGWTEAQLGGLEFEADNFDDRTEVRYTAPQRASVLARLLLLKPGDIFHNDWVSRFDPVRTDYVISWTSPAGELRPLIYRAVIFFVPETAKTTRLHVMTFLKLSDPRYRPLLPIVRRAALALGWLEVRDDALFVPHVADTPFDLKGMRLGKFDKPLIHNHKLLRKLYWADEAETVSPGSPARV